MYCDADWGNGEDRKSIGTYVGILAGGIVSYKAEKQPTVSTSSTEGEYIWLYCRQLKSQSIVSSNLIEELKMADEMETIKWRLSKALRDVNTLPMWEALISKVHKVATTVLHSCSR